MGRTGGFWHVEPEEATGGRGIAICAEDAIVAVIDPEGEADAEDWANARYLAAAPQLYDALLAVYQDLELNDVWGGSDELNLMVQAALKAVEGQPA